MNFIYTSLSSVYTLVNCKGGGGERWLWVLSLLSSILCYSHVVFMNMICMYSSHLRLSQLRSTKLFRVCVCVYCSLFSRRCARIQTVPTDAGSCSTSTNPASWTSRRSGFRRPSRSCREGAYLGASRWF